MWSGYWDSDKYLRPFCERNGVPEGYAELFDNVLRSEDGETVTLPQKP